MLDPHRALAFFGLRRPSEDAAMAWTFDPDRLISHRLLVMAVVVLTGAALGLTIYTFVYAKGFSYLTDKPEACGNCHVMREVVTSWRSGDHHHAAVCNDCHVPHNFVGKWVTKGINGFHHSFAFTFTDVPVAIRAGSLSRAVAQANCERCHGALFHGQSVPRGGGGADAGERRCITCHRQVGHGHP